MGVSDVLEGYDPFAPENWADPHPGYHRLRELAPIWRNEQFDEWVLTRYDDALAVLRDVRFSSNPRHMTIRPELEATDMRLAMRDTGANMLLFIDPPDHTRLRRLVSQAFTPRRVEALRPQIRHLVDGLLDDVAERGEMEVLADLAYPLPVTVICQLMGVPVEDRGLFGSWSSDASRLLDGDLEPEAMSRGVVGAMSLLNYFNELFEERRRQPRDDLVSALIAAEEEGDRLTEEELRSITLLLFIAGHETTMNLIGNGTLALLRHRDQFERLRSDPSLVPSAIEELLRYDGPVHATARIATEDLPIAGQVVGQGEQVIVLLAAANRDPQRFTEPDRVDVARPDNHHLTFSHGIHYCLGAALARVEGQVALGALVQRFPELELATAEPQYRDHKVLRGLKELHVVI